ncbi:MAG: hypothetical protein MMC33_005492 [Icmadophila ericetorum]|nr:hypothetical protein [Icmadophila ericetorum]
MEVNLDKHLSSFRANPLLTAGGVTGLLILYQIVRILYNIFLHPLAKFPGPKLRSAFYFFNYVEEIQGIQADKAKALHDQYGPVVRIGPDSLSFNTAKAWKDIYSYVPGKSEIPKDMKFFTQSTNGIPSILISNHEDHTRIRKLVVHSFSDAALRDQEGAIITGYIDLLISQLKKRIDGPERGKVDMMSWYMFTTFDIMADLCFAESFNALATGEYHPWMRKILNGAKNGSYVRMERAYPMLAGLSQLAKQIRHPTAKLNTARAEHMRNAIEKTEARVRMNTDRKDIMTPILKHNSEKGMSRAEIDQSLILLLTGGTEPTASGMSGVTYNVLRHKRVLDKLTDEVLSSFKSEDEVVNVRTSKLPYLNAVINESLRIYPPVPARFPRRTTKAGAMVDGYFVPPDPLYPQTSLGVHQWATYHSASNFHDPDSFIPERWLPDAPAEFQNDALSSVQPFSTGPRNCIGKPMAYLQIQQMLCRLIINFDMALCDNSLNWKDQKARLLWDMPPLNVQLRYRSGKEGLSVMQ